MSKPATPVIDPETNAAEPVEDFAAVGRALKERREELSYTIEHVAEITRITLSNLRGIEAADIEGLPSLVFVRGFVRNYASLLGLSVDWMVEALNQEYGAMEAAPAEDMLIGNFGSRKKSPMTPIVVGLVLVIGAGAFWFSQSKTGQDEAPETIQSIAAETQDTAQSAEAQKKILQTQISPLTLMLKGKLSQWVSVTVDAELPKKMLLEAGKQYEFPAQEGYQLMMTTGGTAEVYLNGEQIEVSEEASNQLYSSKLNKFSLTRQNN